MSLFLRSSLKGFLLPTRTMLNFVSNELHAYIIFWNQYKEMRLPMTDTQVFYFAREKSISMPPCQFAFVRKKKHLNGYNRM